MWKLYSQWSINISVDIHRVLKPDMMRISIQDPVDLKFYSEKKNPCNNWIMYVQVAATSFKQEMNIKKNT